MLLRMKAKPILERGPTILQAPDAIKVSQLSCLMQHQSIQQQVIVDPVVDPLIVDIVVY